jgi:PAS domain S-box-containing protein
MSLQENMTISKPDTQIAIAQSHKLDANSFTILIVDDSLVSLQMLVENFQLLGYRVLLAASGEEALQIASDMRPDIILLDIVMPGMNGLETCRCIKAQASTQDIPVIFMTALARIGDKISGFRAGAVDYLVKPVRIEEAIARVDTHLKLRDMQRELEEANAELMRQRETLEQQVATRTAELSVKNLRLRTEIAERKRMEQSLRNREREFRTLTENSPDIIVRFDTDCRRIYVNPAYERKNGMPGSVLLGKTPTEFSVNIYPVAALYQEKIETVLETGVACEFDLDWHTLDGKWLCYSVYVVPEYDDSGKIASALTISRDITERRESEFMLRASKEQLRALMEQIETAREDERKYIARELHDELGQLLTGLRMRARLLHPDFIHGDPVWLKECSTDIVRIVDRAVNVVRDVVSALRPGILEMGIASALRWLGDEITQSSGVPCKVSVPQEKLHLDEKIAITLFRIAQESLTNVVKHAQATQAMIVLSLRNQRIHLSISDNGSGFDPDAPRNPDSYGLAGMEERVRMLGGQYEISSTPRKGTAILVTIPLPETVM